MTKKRMQSTLVLSHLILEAVEAYRIEKDLTVRDAFERLLAVGLSDRSPIEIQKLNHFESSPYYIAPRTFNGKILVSGYCSCYRKRR